MNELIVTKTKLQGDEMADAMDMMENAGGNPFRAAQQSEFPMQRLGPQKRKGRGLNDGKLNINSDSTVIT